MDCILCKQPTTEQRDFSYSYDVRGTHFGGKQYEQPCCKTCWDKHWKEGTRYWDEVDEVMNRNKHFQRLKGMIGTYIDGFYEFYPVYAYWKRANIDGSFLFEPPEEEKEYLHKFREWLQENKLEYKYESR